MAIIRYLLGLFLFSLAFVAHADYTPEIEYISRAKYGSQKYATPDALCLAVMPLKDSLEYPSEDLIAVTTCRVNTSVVSDTYKSNVSITGIFQRSSGGAGNTTPSESIGDAVQNCSPNTRKTGVYPNVICNGTAPNPCPDLGGVGTTRARGCTSWTVCQNGCSYPATNIQQHILSATGQLYGSAGSCALELLQCNVFNPELAKLEPITIELPPLSAEERAAYEAQAAAEAKAKADAKAAEADELMDSIRAAAEAKAAADKAAAVADAAAKAAEAKRAEDAAAQAAADWSMANSQALNDAMAAAASAANPSATPEQKAAADAKAAASAADAAASKAALDAAKEGAATAVGNAAGSLVGAIGVGSGAADKPEFCALHPNSIICKDSTYQAGACNAGHLVGEQCVGDAIQCGQARNFNAARCAELQRDGLTDFGQSLINGQSGVPNEQGTLDNPKQINIGSLNSTSFLNKGCLADMTFDIVGQPIKLPLSALCDGLRIAGSIVKFFAYMIALKIIFS